MKSCQEAGVPVNSRVRASFDSVFPVVYAVALALAALAVHLRFFPIGDIGVESDFYQSLARAAQELTEGGFSVASYPYKGPFYSFALAFVHLFGGDWYRSGVILSLLCSAGALIVLYRLILRLFNRRLAVTATVAASLIPSFFMNAHKASTDQLFFLLCMLATSLLLVERWRWRSFFGAGALSALAFLTRYNGAYLVAAAAVVILLVDHWRRPLRHRVAALGAYVVAFFLICAPWFAMNLAETGRLLETENLRNVTEEFYGGEKESEIPEGGFESIGSVIAHGPGYFAGHYLLNIPRHLWYDVERSLGYRLGVPLALGFLLLLIVPPTRRQWAFYSFGIVYFLSMGIVFRIPRFVLPLAPFYAALGLSFIVGPLNEGRTRLGRAAGERLARGVTYLARGETAAARRTAVLAVACIFALQVYAIVESEKWFVARVPDYLLPAARSLKAYAGRLSDDISREIVLARKPHIAYLAGMRYERYPRHLEGGRELLTFAIEHDADYIVYSRVERMYYEDSEWVSGLAGMDGVSRVFSDESTRVFEVADWLDVDEDVGSMRLANMLAALKDAEASGDVVGVPDVCLELSMFFSNNGRPADAGACLERAVQAASGMDDAREANRTIRLLLDEYIGLSRAYFRLGREDEGAELLERGLTRFDGLWAQDDLGAIHTILSMHYTRRNDERSARLHAEAARTLSTPASDLGER